jgi:flagellar biosynthesis GTPase FlhF
MAESISEHCMMHGDNVFATLVLLLLFYCFCCCTASVIVLGSRIHIGQVLALATQKGCRTSSGKDYCIIWLHTHQRQQLLSTSGSSSCTADGTSSSSSSNTDDLNVSNKAKPVWVSRLAQSTVHMKGLQEKLRHVLLKQRKQQQQQQPPPSQQQQQRKQRQQQQPPPPLRRRQQLQELPDAPAHWMRWKESPADQKQQQHQQQQQQQWPSSSFWHQDGVGSCTGVTS